MAHLSEFSKTLLISGEVQTPVYIYETALIDKQIEILKRNKPKNLEIFYAMKGNSAMAILKIFQAKGFSTEIASGGELFLAKTAGFDPKKIIYTGPSKSDEELENSVQFGIKAIHVESVNEAIRLNAICERLGKTQNILVRMNANFEVHTYSTQLSGCPSPFGISEEDFFDALSVILALKNLRFQGIHVYNASGILDVKLLLTNVQNVFELVQNLEIKFPEATCTHIDFGGGLGIDYSGEDKNLDIQDFYQGLEEKIVAFGFQDRHFIMEIARYLVAECGFYCTTIRDIKQSRGTTYYITNGGIHHYMTGRHFDRNHPISILRKNENNEKETVNITGTLCTGIDYMARGVIVPKSELGDIVVIEKTGCYGLSAGMAHFLSHRLPPEILVSEENWKEIRKRGVHEDLLLNQNF